MLKLVEVTFIDNTIRRFKDVKDDSFERKDCYLRFKNEKGETIYINIDKILMWTVINK